MMHAFAALCDKVTDEIVVCALSRTLQKLQDQSANMNLGE